MWMTILQCGSIKRAWEEHHEIQFKFIILSTCVQIQRFQVLFNPFTLPSFWILFQCQSRALLCCIHELSSATIKHQKPKMSNPMVRTPGHKTQCRNWFNDFRSLSLLSQRYELHQNKETGMVIMSNVVDEPRHIFISRLSNVQMLFSFVIIIGPNPCGCTSGLLGRGRQTAFFSILT